MVDKILRVVIPLYCIVYSVLYSMILDLMDSKTIPPLEAQHSLKSHGSNDSNGKNLCVVCDDDSDGLHFGQHTCRACAAFFRRTVSLKLDYMCKHDNNCEIVKSKLSEEENRYTDLSKIFIIFKLFKKIVLCLLKHCLIYCRSSTDFYFLQLLL